MVAKTGQDLHQYWCQVQMPQYMHRHLPEDPPAISRPLDDMISRKSQLVYLVQHLITC